MSQTRLDQVLVERGLSSSRTEAQELIKSGKVLLNKIICIKQTKLVNENDECVVLENRKYVSRGGEKLEGIFEDVYGNDYKAFVKNKTALDIGSSTGGFTDFLLKNDAYMVDAVDVGTEQLHESLLKNTKVNIFENTDIRNFKSNNEYDIVVADLSFISLRDVIDSIIGFGTKKKTKYFLLLKPQFEVGRGNTKKGIVKSIDLVSNLLNDTHKMLTEYGFLNIKILPCCIKGREGNQEYFIFAEI